MSNSKQKIQDRKLLNLMIRENLIIDGVDINIDSIVNDSSMWTLMDEVLKNHSLYVHINLNYKVADEQVWNHSKGVKYYTPLGALNLNQYDLIAKSYLINRGNLPYRVFNQYDVMPPYVWRTFDILTNMIS